MSGSAYKERRVRDERSRWENQEIITDPHLILFLLQSKNSSTRPHHLALEQKTADWELRLEWATERHGHCDNGHYHYEIDQDVAEKLIADRLVEPYLMKDWSCSTPDPNRLVTSREGKGVFERFEEDLREKAKALLVPGKHTDLTGEMGDGWLETEHFRDGPLIVKFHGPEGRHISVNPVTQVVLEDE